MSGLVSQAIDELLSRQESLRIVNFFSATFSQTSRACCWSSTPMGMFQVLTAPRELAQFGHAVRSPVPAIKEEQHSRTP